MNISELVDLSNIITTNDEDKVLISRFDKLISTLKANTTQVRNAQNRMILPDQQSFSENKNELIESLSLFSKKIINKDQIIITEKNNISNLFDGTLREEIIEAFRNEVNDQVFLRDRIKSIRDIVDAAITKIKEDAGRLKPYIESKAIYHHNLDIKFDGEVKIESFQDMKKNADKWNKIFHAISKGSTEHNEVKITHVENGSIIIGLIATVKCLILVRAIVKHSTAIIKESLIEYYEIKKIIEVNNNYYDESLRKSSERMSEMLDDFANEKRKAAIKSAVNKLFSKFPGILNDTPEGRESIKQAIAGIIKHIILGGDVSTKITPEDEEKMAAELNISKEDILEIIKEPSKITISKQDSDFLLSNLKIEDIDSEEGDREDDDK